MKRRIRVCVVSPLYHPSLGGVGRQAQILTERLSEEGVDIFVIARRMKRMPPALFSKHVKVYRAWSIKPYIHAFESEVKLIYILISLTFCISSALFLIWKYKKYDIVHFHGASLPLFFNLPILKLLRKRVIAKVATANTGTEAGSLKGRHFMVGDLINRLLYLVDTFIATSSEIEDGLKKDGFPLGKICRIPNFIDIQNSSAPQCKKSSSIKEELGLREEPLVLFAGKFVPRKGIGSLLKGWKEVVKKSPNARLLLLGDGDIFMEMREMSSGLGIEGSVIFYGHANHVVDFLHAGDIFVLPSLQEGMPNSLLEAMSCGLPIVATRIGGVVDLIQDGRNGILADPGDHHGIAHGIIRLLEDKGYASGLGRAAFHTIQSGYNLDEVIKRYIDLYMKQS